MDLVSCVLLCHFLALAAAISRPAGHAPRLRSAVIQSIDLSTPTNVSQFPLAVQLHVPVRFVEFRESGGPALDNLQFGMQISALNAYFTTSSGFVFASGGFSSVANAEAVTACSRNWTVFRESIAPLYSPSSASFTVFVCPSVGGNSYTATHSMGWAHSPYLESSPPLWAVIPVSALPRSAATTPSGFSPSGAVLARAIGTAFGLLPVASPRGCADSAGDLVGDTVAVASPAFTCATGAAACSASASAEQLALVTTNLMAFSDDGCAENFTDGQIARMQRVVQAFYDFLYSVRSRAVDSTIALAESVNLGNTPVSTMGLGVTGGTSMTMMVLATDVEVTLRLVVYRDGWIVECNTTSTGVISLVCTVASIVDDDLSYELTLVSGVASDVTIAIEMQPVCASCPLDTVCDSDGECSCLPGKSGARCTAFARSNTIPDFFVDASAVSTMKLGLAPSGQPVAVYLRHASSEVTAYLVDAQGGVQCSATTNTADTECISSLATDVVIASATGTAATVDVVIVSVSSCATACESGQYCSSGGSCVCAPGTYGELLECRIVQETFYVSVWMDDYAADDGSLWQDELYLPALPAISNSMLVATATCADPTVLMNIVFMRNSGASYGEELEQTGTAELQSSAARFGDSIALAFSGSVSTSGVVVNVQVKYFPSCSPACGLHGRCVLNKHEKAICFCNPGFAGSDCSICIAGLAGSNCDLECPGGVSSPCYGRGQCYESFGTAVCACDYGVGDACTCSTGRYGPRCELPYSVIVVPEVLLSQGQQRTVGPLLLDKEAGLSLAMESYGTNISLTAVSLNSSLCAGRTVCSRSASSANTSCNAVLVSDTPYVAAQLYVNVITNFALLSINARMVDYCKKSCGIHGLCHLPASCSDVTKNDITVHALLTHLLSTGKSTAIYAVIAAEDVSGMDVYGDRPFYYGTTPLSAAVIHAGIATPGSLCVVQVTPYPGSVVSTPATLRNGVQSFEVDYDIIYQNRTHLEAASSYFLRLEVVSPVCKCFDSVQDGRWAGEQCSECATGYDDPIVTADAHVQVPLRCTISSQYTSASTTHAVTHHSPIIAGPFVAEINTAFRTWSSGSATGYLRVLSGSKLSSTVLCESYQNGSSTAFCMVNSSSITARTELTVAFFGVQAGTLLFSHKWISACGLQCSGTCMLQDTDAYCCPATVLGTCSNHPCVNGQCVCGSNRDPKTFCYTCLAGYDGADCSTEIISSSYSLVFADGGLSFSIRDLAVVANSAFSVSISYVSSDCSSTFWLELFSSGRTLSGAYAPPYALSLAKASGLLDLELSSSQSGTVTLFLKYSPLCSGSNLVHAFCEGTPPTWVCHSNKNLGFWTGSDCSECADGYTGDNCTTQSSGLLIYPLLEYSLPFTVRFAAEPGSASPTVTLNSACGAHISNVVVSTAAQTAADSAVYLITITNTSANCLVAFNISGKSACNSCGIGGECLLGGVCECRSTSFQAVSCSECVSGYSGSFCDQQTSVTQKSRVSMSLVYYSFAKVNFSAVTGTIFSVSTSGTGDVDVFAFTGEYARKLQCAYDEMDCSAAFDGEDYEYVVSDSFTSTECAVLRVVDNYVTVVIESWSTSDIVVDYYYHVDCVDGCGHGECLVGVGCVCHAHATLGYWSGTGCDTCASGYKGSSCTLTCAHGTLLSNGTCECPAASGWTGDLCDTCSYDTGYVGTNCDESLSQVTLEISYSWGPTTSSIGPLVAKAYSLVSVMAVPYDLTNVEALAMTIVFHYSAIPDNYTDISVACADPLGCTAYVPADTPYFSVAGYTITGVPLALWVIITSVHGDCNGHGSLQWDTTTHSSTCICQNDNRRGVWDPTTDCATCYYGFSGSSCTDFDDSARTVALTPSSIALVPGERSFHLLEVQPFTPFIVSMVGTGDCDIDVILVTDVSSTGKNIASNSSAALAGIDSVNAARSVITLSRIFDVPTEVDVLAAVCSPTSPTSNEACNIIIPFDVVYIYIKVIAVGQDASYELNISHVPRARFEDSSNPYLGCLTSSAVWTGTMCTFCQAPFYGVLCDQRDYCTSRADCSDNGDCDASGFCQCDTYYTGATCSARCAKTGANITCVNGQCLESGVCLCWPGFSGEQCDVCQSGYTGRYCNATCSCLYGTCSVSDAGVASCSCFDDDTRGHWAGSTCNSCASGYGGLKCTCSDAATCSAQGTCNVVDGCTCHSGWYGANCNVPCNPDIDCNGRGTCGADGACLCSQISLERFRGSVVCNADGTISEPTRSSWDGPSCNVCSSGFWGDDCSKLCDCSTHGTCNRTSGECHCARSDAEGYWDGLHCEVCLSGYSGDLCTTASSSAGSVHTRLDVLRGTIGRTRLSLHGASLLYVYNNKEFLCVASGGDLVVFSRPYNSPDPRDFSEVGVFCIVGRLDLAGVTITIVGMYETENSYWVLYNSDSGRAAFLAFSKTDPLAVGVSPAVLKAGHQRYVAPADAGSLYATTIVMASTAGFQDRPGEVFIAYAGRSAKPRSGSWTAASVQIQSVYLVDLAFNATSQPVTGVSMAGHEPNIPINFELTPIMGFPGDTDYRNVASMAFGQEDSDGYLLIFFHNSQNVIFMSKLYVPSVALPTFRYVSRVIPSVCKHHDCDTMTRAVAVSPNGTVVAAIQTTTATIVVFDVNPAAPKRDVLGSIEIAGARDNVTGMFLNTDGFLYVFASEESASETKPTLGVSLFRDAVNSTTTLFSKTDVTLPLSYGSTGKDPEIVVSAIAGTEKVLYLVVATRLLSVVPINLYDVFSVEPNIVAAPGGTIVDIYGHGFTEISESAINSSTAIANGEPLDTVPRCFFGDVAVEAEILSSTHAQCEAPPSLFSGCDAVPLEFTIGPARRRSTNSVQVRYAALPVITSLSKKRGYYKKSYQVTVYGSGFENSKWLACFVDSIRVPGEYLTPGSVLCTLPPRSSASVTTLEVSLDNQVPSVSQLSYAFVGDAYDLSIAVSGDDLEAANITTLPTLNMYVRDIAGTPIKSLQNYGLDLLITYQMTDTFGNITSSSVVPVDGDASISSLHLERPRVGNVTILFSLFANGSLLHSTSTTLTVHHGSPHSLIFSVQPETYALAGDTLPVSPVVHVQDVAGNDITSKLSVSATGELLRFSDHLAIQALDFQSFVSSYAEIGTPAITDRVESGVSYFIEVTFMGLTVSSDSFVIAHCPSDRSNTDFGTTLVSPSRIHIPSGAANISVWGSGFERILALSCEYTSGSATFSTAAIFSDGCNVICPGIMDFITTPGEISVALEVQYSSGGSITTPTSLVTMVGSPVAVRPLSSNTLAADRSVSMDLVITLLDSAGNEVRSFAESSTAAIAITYPNGTRLNVRTFVFTNGEVSERVVILEYPVIGTYTLHCGVTHGLLMLPEVASSVFITGGEAAALKLYRAASSYGTPGTGLHNVAQVMLVDVAGNLADVENGQFKIYTYFHLATVSAGSTDFEDSSSYPKKGNYSDTVMNIPSSAVSGTSYVFSIYAFHGDSMPTGFIGALGPLKTAPIRVVTCSQGYSIEPSSVILASTPSVAVSATLSQLDETRLYRLIFSGQNINVSCTVYDACTLNCDAFATTAPFSEAPLITEDGGVFLQPLSAFVVIGAAASVAVRDVKGVAPSLEVHTQNSLVIDEVHVAVVDSAGSDVSQSVLFTVTATPSGILVGNTQIASDSGTASFVDLTFRAPPVGLVMLFFGSNVTSGLTNLTMTVYAGEPETLDMVVEPAQYFVENTPLVIQPILRFIDASGGAANSSFLTIWEAVEVEASFHRSTVISSHATFDLATEQFVFSDLAISAVGSSEPQRLQFSTVNGPKTISGVSGVYLNKSSCSASSALLSVVSPRRVFASATTSFALSLQGRFVSSETYTCIFSALNGTIFNTSIDGIFIDSCNIQCPGFSVSKAAFIATVKILTVSTQVISDSISFASVGEAAKIFISARTTVYRCDSSVAIDPINVYLVDRYGTQLLDYWQQNGTVVRAVLQSPNGTALQEVSVPVVNGMAEFTDFILSTPLVGDYTVTFQSSCCNGTKSWVFAVIAGAPAAMSFLGSQPYFTNSREPLYPQPVLAITDIGGNYADVPTFSAIIVSVVITPYSLLNGSFCQNCVRPTITQSNAIVVVSSSVATFTQLQVTISSTPEPWLFSVTYSIPYLNGSTLVASGTPLYRAICASGTNRVSSITNNSMTACGVGDRNCGDALNVTVHGWGFRSIDTHYCVFPSWNSPEIAPPGKLVAQYVDSCTLICSFVGDINGSLVATVEVETVPTDAESFNSTNSRTLTVVGPPMHPGGVSLFSVTAAGECSSASSAQSTTSTTNAVSSSATTGSTIGALTFAAPTSNSTVVRTGGTRRFSRFAQGLAAATTCLSSADISYIFDPPPAFDVAAHAAACEAATFHSYAVTNETIVLCNISIALQDSSGTAATTLWPLPPVSNISVCVTSGPTSDGSLTLGGRNTREFVNGVVSFDTTEPLYFPAGSPVGTYVLLFSLHMYDVLYQGEMYVILQPGQPATLFLRVLPANATNNANILSPQPAVGAKDIYNNTLTLAEILTVEAFVEIHDPQNPSVDCNAVRAKQPAVGQCAPPAPCITGENSKVFDGAVAQFQLLLVVAPYKPGWATGSYTNYGDANETFIPTFSTELSAPYKLWFCAPNASNIAPITADLYTSDCSVGFYMNVTNPGRDQCIPCPGCVDGSTSCVHCDGTDVIEITSTPFAQYWQYSGNTTSLLRDTVALDTRSYPIYRCSDTQACQGGPTYKPGVWPREQSVDVCGPGYFGAACSACDVDNNYGRQGVFCSTCPPLVRNAVIVVSLILVVCVVIAIMVSLQLSTRTRRDHQIIVKQLINHMQVAIIVASFQSQWPGFIRDLFSKVLSPITGGTSSAISVASFDCLTGFTFFEKFWLYLTLPFTTCTAIVVFLGLLYGIRTFFHWKGTAFPTRERIELDHEEEMFWLELDDSERVALVKRRMPVKKFIALSWINVTTTTFVAMVVVLFLIYPSLLQFSTLMWFCDTYDPSGDYLRSDPSIQCGDTKHTFYRSLAAGFALFYGVGIPVLAVLFVRHRRNAHASDVNIADRLMAAKDSRLIAQREEAGEEVSPEEHREAGVPMFLVDHCSTDAVPSAPEDAHHHDGTDHKGHSHHHQCGFLNKVAGSMSKNLVVLNWDDHPDNDAGEYSLEEENVELLFTIARDAQKSDNMFAFIIAGFKPQYWYYEMFIMGRKMVMSLAVAFLNFDSRLQTYACLWVMLLALLLTVAMMPFEKNSLNHLEIFLLSSEVVVINLGLLYYTFPVADYGVSTLPITLLIVFFIVAPILVAAYMMIRSMYIMLRELLGVEGGMTRAKCWSGFTTLIRWKFYAMFPSVKRKARRRLFEDTRPDAEKAANRPSIDYVSTRQLSRIVPIDSEPRVAETCALETVTTENETDFRVSDQEMWHPVTSDSGADHQVPSDREDNHGIASENDHHVSGGIAPPPEMPPPTHPLLLEDSTSGEPNVLEAVPSYYSEIAPEQNPTSPNFPPEEESQYPSWLPAIPLANRPPVNTASTF